MPKISIVILCYKAGEEILPLVDKIKTNISKATEDFELVLVGNYHEGDTEDSTPRIVRELADNDPRIIAVTRIKKGMMSWDARTGLDAATGDAIALIDGDNQMPPEDLPRVYEELTSKYYDIVTTYRIKRGDSSARRVNSKAYNTIFNALFPGYPIKDVNSKPKIFTRSFFSKLKLQSTDWFLDAEIMIQARRHKARLGQIPTEFFRPQYRKSFVRLGAVFEFFKNLAIYRIKEFFI